MLYTFPPLHVDTGQTQPYYKLITWTVTVDAFKLFSKEVELPENFHNHGKIYAKDKIWHSTPSVKYSCQIFQEANEYNTISCSSKVYKKLEVSGQTKIRVWSVNEYILFSSYWINTYHQDKY